MQPQLLAATRDLVAPLMASRPRTVVGIAGPPGAGKSTLAEALAADLGGVCVPMDGFHLSNVELRRLGLANRKGAPETFDAAGFVHLLRRIRRGDELVYAPAFDRGVNESIGGAIPVSTDVALVVVEGNYLLVPEEPWVLARPLFDLVVYVDAPAAVRVPGLVRRQRSRGLDDAAARDWVLRSDEANAALIARTRDYADAVLTRSRAV
jgi:pantothenate kinase